MLTTPDELRNFHAEEMAQMDLSTGVLGETVPGDVVIFHSLAPHRSELNRSNRSRRRLYLSYNAMSAGDVYQSQQAHYRAYASRNTSNELYFQ